MSQLFHLQSKLRAHSPHTLQRLCYTFVCNIVKLVFLVFIMSWDFLNISTAYLSQFVLSKTKSLGVQFCGF